MSSEGAFGDFLGGVGTILNDAVGGLRDVLVAREATRKAEVDRTTATQVSLALGGFELTKFRIVAFSVLGVLAVWLMTRRRGA